MMVTFQKTLEKILRFFSPDFRSVVSVSHTHSLGGKQIVEIRRNIQEIDAKLLIYDVNNVCNIQIQFQ